MSEPSADSPAGSLREAPSTAAADPTGHADPTGRGAGAADTPGVPAEPSAAARESDPALVQRIVGRLLSMGDSHGPEIPGWLAQELTFGQLRVLFLLSRQGPAPMSRVAEWLGVGLPTASGVVDRIERHGLAAREHRPDDRRIVECRLTEAGRALIADITGRQLDAMRRLLALLRHDELILLDQVIAAVIERKKQVASS